MAPLLPRMDVFEFDDQPWFPSFLRGRVQASLTILWNLKVPLLQVATPSSIVVDQLLHYLGNRVRDYVFIDFCAGGGGPTPFIEKRLNDALTALPALSSNGHANGHANGDSNGHANGHANGSTNGHANGKANGHTNGHANGNANGHANGALTDSSSEKEHEEKHEAIRFVLTDLHPHVDNWSKQAEASPNISYVSESVDASNAPASLFKVYKDQGKKVFRLFFLAFHHFNDDLARAILKNTVETSHGFAIFELQERTFTSFMTLFMFGIAAVILAPYYAWKWRSPASLFFSWVIPVLPFVLTFDGWMSALRTRTPDEVQALLQTCGADPKELARWKMQSGRKLFFHPASYINWIVCERE